MRRTIALQKNQVIDLKGYFGLHPAMQLLKPLWDRGHLAIVHAAGSPDESRSRFDAQDYMESGTPGVKSTPDGWLAPGLAGMPARGPASPFRAESFGAALPRILRGSACAAATTTLNAPDLTKCPRMSGTPTPHPHP